MLKKLLIVTITYILLCISAHAQQQEYIVRFKDTGMSLFGTDVSVADLDPSLKDVVPEWNLYTTTDEEQLQEYIDAGLVEYFEADRTVELFDSYTYVPQDIHFKHQDNITRINSLGGWNMGAFGNDVVVGVIDSGITYHDDMLNNILAGRNYLADTDDLVDDVTDTEGHGTLCSSIISAEANYIGVTGIAPMAKIVPLRCFDNKSGSISNIVKAIKDAVDVFDCDIINMSFGDTKSSTTLKDTIDYAYSKGAILVAAAGNKHTTAPMYPGAYTNVINVASVGMTNSERNNADSTQVDVYNNLSSFSNYGKVITVVAPGASVEGYDNIHASTISNSGTSFAAPIVTAIAALCKGIDKELNHDEFVEILTTTCIDLGAEGKDDYFGYGLVDVHAAVKKTIEQCDVYISPVNIINKTAFHFVTNNTDAPVEYADIWYNSDSLMLNPLTVASGETEISFVYKPDADNLRHYLWDSMLSLRPLYKYISNDK